jgi:protein TonB
VSVGARLLYGPPPGYPATARAAEIEADVPLEIVVDARGAVVDARGRAHAGYGLDEAAARAVRAYRFAPAQRGGVPVAVRMRWTMQFRLR